MASANRTSQQEACNPGDLYEEANTRILKAKGIIALLGSANRIECGARDPAYAAMAASDLLNEADAIFLRLSKHAESAAPGGSSAAGA